MRCSSAMCWPMAACSRASPSWAVSRRSRVKPIARPSPQLPDQLLAHVVAGCREAQAAAVPLQPVQRNVVVDVALGDVAGAALAQQFDSAEQRIAQRFAAQGGWGAGGWGAGGGGGHGGLLLGARP